MKKYLLLIALLVILGAVLVQWRQNGRAPARAGTSWSQIYIHDSPVCIIKDGDTITARVGECGPDEQGDGHDGELGDEAPFQGSPEMNLPPGHPPVGPDTTPGPSRRIAI